VEQEIWQQLLSLESRDVTQQWFSKIHGRELNVRRAKEINAAAKQSREYFRNASNSNYSVRPLLTYYGVASLSRALLLLLRKEGGEEGLKSGHGLMTVDWGEILSGDTSVGLAALLNLKIQTCSGLYSDFVRGTNNRVSIHVSSSAVDWRLNYNTPDEGYQVSLGDLFSRIPDLLKDYSNISSEIRYTNVNEMSYDQQNGFKAKVRHEHFEHFKNTYQDMGYKIDTQGQWSTLTCDASTFSQNLPLFIHSYVQKTFGAIPNLHIAEPFSRKVAYSQLGITFLTAYFLGMLARYFPTHWISLIQGEKGDALWPTINRAQQFVENSYPELVIEMIYDMIKENEKKPSN
jgi:hypothetical protein